MGDHDEIVAAVYHLLKKLTADPVPESHRILRILQRLERLPITVRVLQETGVGKAVNKLRKQGGEITDAVKGLVQSWRDLVREAMEAEQKTPASPERGSSPSSQSGSSDEDEDESSEEDSSSDDSSESDREDEGRRKRYSPEPSPPYASPPPSPPVRDSRPKPPTNRHVSVTGKERVSSKRPHAPSPSRCQDAPQTHLSTTSSSQIKKRRIEERPSSDASESSKVVKKKPPEDDCFSQALFPSPRKVGSSSSSSLPKSPVHIQKDRGGDKTGSPTKLAKPGHSLKPSSSGSEKSNERSLSKSPQKKVNQKNDQERTKSKTSDSRVINGSVREPETSFLDMIDDVDVSKHNNANLKTNKISSQASSKISSVSKSSISSASSSKSSTQKKPGSASLTPSADRESAESSRTAEKSAHREHARTDSKSSKESRPSQSSEKVSSKSKAVSSSVKPTEDSQSKSSAKESLAPKSKRKLSTGERRISEEGTQSFVNTGLSFGDILMAPTLTTKVKKPGKRLNTGATDSTKKSSSSSATSKSSSKPSSKSSSSSSTHAIGSSSSKHISQKNQGSKSASTSGKGNKKVHSKDDGKNRGEQIKSPTSFTPTLEDVHQDITFNLPEISADYKPLRLPELSPKKKVRGQDEEGSYIGSRFARTKLYTGRARQSLSSVPSLYDACMRVLLDNIDALYEVGVPYDIIKPVLEKCTPLQLLHLEDYNPYLIEDTDELWRTHAEKDFRKFKPQEMESFRELYLRKKDEREEKLKNITANIKTSFAKKDPGRLTKMAFVHGPAKPPRAVQRQQVRHGTGRITSSPPSNPHKAYVPSKHAGDTGPIRSSSTSTIKSGEYAERSHSGGGGSRGGGGGSSGGGGERRGNPSYESISMSSCNGGSSRGGGRSKASKAPMMQKVLRMKKLFRK
ncbi:transcription elongation factor B polypeptide 3 isoform X1 [Strongylocentrotus purpuratus]|uniref:TFIIS N-terminal domain-containing protein n=1 Tax=Strongylocentrotus purpuratus TaxID=7668 RepID=A0A7M7RIP4_STRPU|nr:transcription elongation factor B polypeptide 3 isoform X1 [Strongylocentrotus purpuratus]|eukprot:XP_797640.3 PREDICTED: transcription elongation factor B polypeptide 3 isoform X1 [Strongylocentrotus purpuratus]